MGLCWLSTAAGNMSSQQETGATRHMHPPTSEHTNYFPGGHTLAEPVLAPECTASVGPYLSLNHFLPFSLASPCDII